jgi:hypothetical protein
MAAWSLALWAIVIVAALLVIGLNVWRSDDGPVAQAPPTIAIGTPGGVVVEDPTPSPVPEPTPEPTRQPAPQQTPTPTPEATPVPATPPPPTAVPTPLAATPMPATPGPTPVVVAAGDPAEAVAAFYGHVAAGRYDAAYSLWSERMRTTYPRSANLDDRFDETASIAFEQLYVAEQTPGDATVQANFVETYESGSSRQFVGYWRLVLVDGRWLLDEPHY